MLKGGRKGGREGGECRREEGKNRGKKYIPGFLVSQGSHNVLLIPQFFEKGMCVCGWTVTFACYWKTNYIRK